MDRVFHCDNVGLQDLTGTPVLQILGWTRGIHLFPKHFADKLFRNLGRRRALYRRLPLEISGAIGAFQLEAVSRPMAAMIHMPAETARV